jgi:Phosphotransferase enzyme family
VPVADGAVWFKACGPVQRFEPRLTAGLAARSPELVAEVLAWDEERAWLLLADAGTPIGAFGDLAEVWPLVLPRYAELQRGEAERAAEHLEHGVPDLRVAKLPERYEWLLDHELPLEDEEIERLRAFTARFTELCAELVGHGIPDTIQHDDLHGGNVYAEGKRLRVLDWGDSSIGHPFASLVVTFRFLEEFGEQLPRGTAAHRRLRDAYLEPWGAGHEVAFELAIRIGAFAHACAWARQRDHLPETATPEFDRWFAVVLRRAIDRIAS